jgi:hypothetical protein
MKKVVEMFRTQGKRVDYDFLKDRSGGKNSLFSRMTNPTKMDNQGFNYLIILSSCLALVSHYVIRPSLEQARDTHKKRRAEMEAEAKENPGYIEKSHVFKLKEVPKSEQN